jgi:hyperosmotically inducible periplasmic protein
MAFAMLGVSNYLVPVNANAQSSPHTAPDNSVQNKNQATTADQQTNAKSDRMMAAQIRKAIIADKGLSTYAHNVKVVVLNGNVTLTGPVKSDDEKQKVATDTASVVSASNIANQLTVKQ